MKPSNSHRTDRSWIPYLTLGLGTLVALLIILDLTPSAAAEGYGDWPPDAGLEWIVDEETYGFNASIRLTDAIIVRNSSTLRLENVTFTFASQQLDDIGIRVVGDSRLEMMNVTFQAGGPGGYYLELGENVGGFFDNVTISGVASAQRYADGAVIDSDTFTITNSTFHDARYGLLTSGDLLLENNTFYNTSVAILSSGDLHLDKVADNIFEHSGYNNTQARFLHLIAVDLDVVDQDDDTLGSARVVAVDQFQVQRFSMLSWNDGKLWGARLVNEELSITGEERYPTLYNITVSYITTNKTFSLDLEVTTTLHMVLPLLPELVAGPLYAPLPASLEVIRPGRDNATTIRWTDLSAPGGDWQELDHDDESWYDGILPLGNNTVEDVASTTLWEGGVAYLRIYFYIPLGSIIHNGTLHWSAMAPIGGDRVNIYLNGPDALAAWQGSGSYWSFTKEVSRDGLRPGLNVLTVRYQTQETPFFDLQLEVLVARTPEDPLISGSPQELMAVVTNSGSRDAEAVDVELWVDDQLTRSLVRNIPSNASRIYLFELPNLTAAAHTFELRLDPLAELNETDRGDNIAWLNASAYNVAFEVLTPPDDLEMYTYDRSAVIVEVINRGEVDDWPRLAVEWPWSLWSLELVRPPSKIAPDERANLTLWIAPPASIAADDYQMELELGSGLGPSAPDNSDTFNFTITILQSLDLAFQDPTSTQLYPLGAETPLSLNLTNPGNIPFTANLSLVGLAGTEADGWNITLLTKQATLAAGATYQVNLQVLLLSDGARSPTTLTLHASTLADPLVQDDITVELIPAGFSTADELAPYQRLKTFYLPWSVLDHEGTIERVELHYRELAPGGSWSSWILFYTDLELGVQPPFTGLEGYTYEFHTIAVFSGGDREDKAVAEASTIMDLTSPRSRLIFHTPVDGDRETVITLLNLSWRPLDLDVQAYNIELKMDNGPWILLEENTTLLDGTYQLEAGHSYIVRSRAWDLAGWQEADSSGLNRVSFTILERPYLVRLATSTGNSLEAGITGWILLEPMAQVRKVQIQYLDQDDEWVTFQSVTLAGPTESPAQNTSFALNLPLEGVNLLRAVVEDDDGAPVMPGDWQVTTLGNGVSGLEMTLQRRPIWDTLTVRADPQRNGSFDLELNEGLSPTGYTRTLNPALVTFGDGVRGYRPGASESIRATYMAYDVRVVRDSEAPLAPIWREVSADNQSRTVNLELELAEPKAVVAFWFEKATHDIGPWTRFTVSDITILPEDNIVSQHDTNLTPGEPIYFRLGVKDRYDRVTYSAIQEVNLSKVPASTDTDTTSTADTGGLTGSHIMLITLVALVLVGGIMAKFFMDGRRERESSRYPYPPMGEDGYRDYSMVGFDMVGGSLEDRLTVECRACGTRRNVTARQADEEITCFGCGCVSTFVQLEEEIVDDEPSEEGEPREDDEPRDDDEPLDDEGTQDDEDKDDIPEDDDTRDDHRDRDDGTDGEADGEPSDGHQRDEHDDDDDSPAASDAFDGSGASDIEDDSREYDVSEEPQVVAVVPDEHDDDTVTVEVQPETDEQGHDQDKDEDHDGELHDDDTPPWSGGTPSFCPDCGKALGPISPEELASCGSCGWSE